MASAESHAIRHMYRTDLRMFLQFAFRTLHPGIEYQHNWSIDVLGEALARCHRRETTRLIINMPPRSLKSVCTSVAFPAWMLGVEPQSKILCIAGHRQLADEHHHLSHQLITNDRYRGLFPHLQVTEKPGQLKLAQGGSRHAFTPTGAVTGKGADMIIIDDPQSTQQADDPRMCTEICNWYDRNIYQRLNEKQNGVIIVVMQRLSSNDLTSHLLEQDDWEVLSLPAIAMEDEYFPQSLGGKLVRRKGESLHPARESRQKLRSELMRMGAEPFMAQYQQCPYAPGQIHNRGCVYHTAPHIDATPDECKFSDIFFTCMPETQFTLESVFGEQSCIRVGMPPRLNHEKLLELETHELKHLEELRRSKTNTTQTKSC